MFRLSQRENGKSNEREFSRTLMIDLTGLLSNKFKSINKWKILTRACDHWKEGILIKYHELVLPLLFWVWGARN